MDLRNMTDKELALLYWNAFKQGVMFASSIPLEDMTIEVSREICAKDLSMRTHLTYNEAFALL